MNLRDLILARFLQNVFIDAEPVQYFVNIHVRVSKVNDLYGEIVIKGSIINVIINSDVAYRQNKHFMKIDIGDPDCPENFIDLIYDFVMGVVDYRKIRNAALDVGVLNDFYEK